MRTIREMLGNDEKVWVYLNNEDTWKEFTNMAETEGFHFGELPSERWTFGYVIAVHSNGDMGHLPMFIWCRSFSVDSEKCPRKLDFSKYIDIEDDYYCNESHFTCRLMAKNNMIG